MHVYVCLIFLNIVHEPSEAHREQICFAPSTMLLSFLRLSVKGRSEAQDYGESFEARIYLCVFK